MCRNVKFDKYKLDQVTCADQYVSRGDMWRFKDNLVGTCTYKKKHMDFSWIHVQVASLYDESGEEMLSGYISENTHVTYRSLSSYTQLFIQVENIPLMF